VRKAIFHPAALAAIKRFPKPARQALGAAILDLQHGARLGMPVSRPMPVVAPSVHELRVWDRAGIYRAFYLMEDPRGILVFHAFEKRTQKTTQHEVHLAKKRLREVRQ
jgi:phage-related protein